MPPSTKTGPEHSKEMASLADLIEGVAHDVNNSLSNIRLAGEVIIEDLEEESPEVPLDTDYLKGKLTNIIREVDRARAVLSELFQVSRAEGFEKEPLSLKMLLNRALAAQRGISDSIQVEMSINDDLMVAADEHMLTTALANVVSHALSAIDGTGSVEIRAGRHSDGMVEVTVTNTGKPVPEADLDKVFNPFFSTKKARRGKGLGLYVPYQIVKRHNGTLEAVNPPRGGTTLRLTLPSLEGTV